MPVGEHKTVCVISELQLQNGFIARRLEEQANVNCFTAESIEQARLSLGEHFERITFFLWDCWNEELARVVESVKAVASLLPKRSTVGLFNVDRKHWDHGTVLPPQVKGIFFVEISVEDFLDGVSCMLEGKSRLAFDQESCVDEDISSDELLTPREKTLLSLIKQGKSNQEIADTLGVAYSTVKNHCDHLFRKLKVPNRFQAALKAKDR